MDSQDNSTGVINSEPSKMTTKWIFPKILTGVAAILLVGGVATASYFVSNRLATGSGLTPNAPSSEPFAKGSCEDIGSPAARQSCRREVADRIARATGTPTPTKTTTTVVNRPATSQELDLAKSNSLKAQTYLAGATASRTAANNLVNQAQNDASKAKATLSNTQKALTDALKITNPTQRASAVAAATKAVEIANAAAIKADAVVKTTTTKLTAAEAAIKTATENAAKLRLEEQLLKSKGVVVVTVLTPAAVVEGNNGQLVGCESKYVSACESGDKRKYGDTVVGTGKDCGANGYTKATCSNWDTGARRGCVTGYYPCGDGDCCKIGR